MANLAGRKVLFVIAPRDFRDEELLVPRAVLEQAGVRVELASPQAATATGMLGARVTPDRELRQCVSGDYDAIVVVGGAGSPAFLWDNPDLHTLLRDFQRQGKVIAGICLSSAALARAGVLNGLNATVFETKDSLAALTRGGARPTKQDVVVDGRVVTANGPPAAQAFGGAILSLLAEAT